MRYLGLLFLLCATAAGPARAQSESPTSSSAAQAIAGAGLFGQARSKVRVWAPAVSEKPVVGYLRKVRGDTLYLGSSEYSSRTIALPVASVTRVQVSRGKAPWAKRAGAVLGVVAGGAIGAAIGDAAVQDKCEDEPCTLGEALNSIGSPSGGEFGFLVGALLGGVLGSSIGDALTPERWESVWVDKVRVGVGRRGGISVSLALPSRF
jgi:outer membrane lipoprotein SlyB